MSEERALTVAQQRNKTIKGYLNSPTVLNKIKECAGQFMGPEEMVRAVLMAVSRQPRLLECTPDSFLRCCMDAAELKIRIGGVQGRGYLVPRYNKKIGAMEACFDPGWRGLADVARRTGQILSISAHVVFEADKFEVEFGLHEDIRHVPCLEANRGKIVAAYAVAKLRDGATQIEVLTKEDLNRIRAVSTSSSGPWFEWEDEMSRKSAFKRLSKWLPYSVELELAIVKSNKADGFDLDTVGEPIDGDDIPEVTQSSAPPPVAQLAENRTISLKDQLAAARKQEEKELAALNNGKPTAPQQAVTPAAKPEPRTREPGEDDL